MHEPVQVVILAGTWPVPSESPPCLKLLTWLRMAGIEHRVSQLKGRPRSRTNKVPYLLRNDGSLLDDSSVIIETLTREHGIGLDDQRDPGERAAMVFIQRTVEAHLYFVVLCQRWQHHWEQTREGLFGALPWPLRSVVPPLLRRGVLAQLHGQGVGRRPFAEIEAEAVADVEALAQTLGDHEFFFGSVGVTDAIVYGTLQNIRACPIEGALKRAVCENERLMRYLDRITERYWTERGG